MPQGLLPGQESDASLLLGTFLMLHHPPARNVLCASKHNAIPAACQGRIESRLLDHPDDPAKGDYQNRMRDLG